jgi:hypothetical protein
MRESPKIQTWVVYETLKGPMAGLRSVCTASDWKLVESRDPTMNQIIKDGISTENEAEKLARGTSGDQKPRQTAPRPKFE